MKMVGSPTDMAEDVGEERIGSGGVSTGEKGSKLVLTVSSFNPNPSPRADCSVVSSQMAGNFVLLGTRDGDIFEVKKVSIGDD